jgi:cell fate (sporulation/competence/biofilm development) regulator YlbF (YheA/YmcA/DUF963 family)
LKLNIYLLDVYKKIKKFARRMSLKVKNSNHDLNKNNKINTESVSTSNHIGSIIEFSTLIYDIEQIENYDNIDDFLSFIKDNNFSIYTLDGNYFTIFHILIQASRISDFKKITNYVKEHVDAYKIINEFTYLKKMLKSIMENDDDELDHDQITNIYSNLEKMVVLHGFFDEEKDKEIIENIEFISNHLRQIITDLLNSLSQE